MDCGGRPVVTPTSPPPSPGPVSDPSGSSVPTIQPADPRAHLQSVAGLNQNVIGQVTSDYVAPAATGVGEFRVFTSVNYESMTTGTVYKFDLTATPRVVIDKLLPDVKKLSSDLPDQLQLHVSPPGGIPFTDRTLGDFFGVPDLPRSTRNLYVVVTRPIQYTVLARYEHLQCLKPVLGHQIPHFHLQNQHWQCQIHRRACRSTRQFNSDSKLVGIESPVFVYHFLEKD
jgi:hypothetical protein